MVEAARVWVDKYVEIHPGKGIFVDIVPVGPETHGLLFASLRYTEHEESSPIWRPKHKAKLYVYGGDRGCLGSVCVDSMANFTIIPYEMGTTMAFQFTVGPGEFPVTMDGMGGAHGYMRELVVETNGKVLRRVKCVWLTHGAIFEGVLLGRDSLRRDNQGAPEEGDFLQL